MPPPEEALRALGDAIRAQRLAAALTQSALGRRAGIVGKYVSEIERGTRDIPFSTLKAIVEDGLGLRLDVRLLAPGGAVRSADRPTLSPQVEEIARSIVELPTEQRNAVLAIARRLVQLARLG